MAEKDLSQKNQLFVGPELKEQKSQWKERPGNETNIWSG
jgi:hypothetical protein